MWKVKIRNCVKLYFSGMKTWKIKILTNIKRKTEVNTFINSRIT